MIKYTVGNEHTDIVTDRNGRSRTADGMFRLTG